jgi:hypothetical protein
MQAPGSRKRLIAIGVALLAVAGCGGGGGRPLTAADYSARVNALCQVYQQRVSKIGAGSIASLIRPISALYVPVYTATDADKQHVLALGKKLVGPGPVLLQAFDQLLSGSKKLHYPMDNSDLSGAVEEWVPLLERVRADLSGLLDDQRAGRALYVHRGAQSLDAEIAGSPYFSDRLNAPACLRAF